MLQISRTAWAVSLVAAVLIGFFPLPFAVAQSDVPRRFDFGSGPVAAGYTQVLPTQWYSREAGYGFEPGATIESVRRERGDALTSDFCTSDQPFYFSVKAPEGNYSVTVTL